MKNAILIGLMAVLPALAAAQENTMTDDQKTLYFLGHNVLSRNLKQFNFTPEESKYILQGLSDALYNVPSKVDESYGSKLSELITRKQTATAQQEKEKGKAFLEKMSKEKNAQKLPDGVIYIPVKEGTGAAPKATDMVKVEYHGTFPDGKVFDSSIDRKSGPVEFPLNGVIPCWTEGVQKMKVGGKAKLVCPSDTAYGDQGMLGAIPGGATLVFEVELVDIVKADKKQPAAAPKQDNPAKAKENPAKAQEKAVPAGKK